MPAPYSAGSIFLQIVPSFRGVQEQIQREAREWPEAISKPFDEGMEKVAQETGRKVGKEMGRQVAKELSPAGKEAAKRFSDEFERETRTKNLFRSVEQDAEEAGKKAAKNLTSHFDQTIKNLHRSLTDRVATIRVDADDKKAQAVFRQLKRDIALLDAQAEIGMDLNPGTTMIVIQRINAALHGLQDTAGNIKARVDFANVYKEGTKVEAYLKGLSAINIEPTLKIDKQLGSFERGLRSAIENAVRDIGDVDIGASSTAGQRAIGALRRELFDLQDRTIGVDISAEDARANLERIRDELNQITRENWSVDLDANTAAAAASLEGFLALLETIDGRHVDIDVDVKDAVSAIHSIDRLKRAADGARRSGDDAANSFRAFNFRVLGLAAIGPLVVPALGAAAGALAAIGPLAAVAAAGIGVLVLGMFGVGDAVKAMGEARVSAVKDTQEYERGVRTATEGIADAERDLGRAREDAAQGAQDSARQVQDALRGVTDAERNLRDAQRDALQAQEDLTQARVDAAEELEDLNLQVRGGALDQRQAVLDLREAEEELAAARREGLSGDDLERYVLALDRAKLRVDATKESNQDLSAEQARWARTGIEGSDQVVAAQGRVRDANERIADAERGMIDAQREVADARESAARQAVDGQRRIEDAQRALSEAQVAYTEAVTKTSSAQDKLTESMNALGPAGREFVFFIDGLRPKLQHLRSLAQEGFLPGLTDWIDSIVTHHGPLLESTVARIGTALGNMFSQFGASLRGPAFTSLFQMMERSGPAFIAMMGSVLVNLGEGVASLVVAMEPLTYLFGSWLEQASARFADWAFGLRETQGFAEFLVWVERIGPKIADFFIALGGAIINLGVALAPYAETLLGLFTGFLNWIAGMDPGQLRGIAVGLTAIVIAFQIIVGLNALVAGFTTVINIARAAMVAFGIGSATGGALAATGFAAIAGGIAIALAAILLIVAGFYLAYTQLDWFREGVQFVWGLIVDAFDAAIGWLQENFVPVWNEVWAFLGRVANDVWTEILEPIFTLLGEILTDIWEGLKWAWDNIGWPVFVLIGSVISTMWTIIGPIFGFMTDTFRTVWDVLALLWNRVGKPIFDAIIATIQFLWDEVFKPVFEFIGGVIAAFIEGLQWMWEQVDQIVGWVSDRFGELKDAVVTALEGVQDSFQSMVESLATTWFGEEGGSQLIDTIKGAWHGVQEDLDDDNSKIKAGWDLFWQDMETIFAGVKERLTETIGGFTEGVKSKFTDMNIGVTESEKRTWETIKAGWNDTVVQVGIVINTFVDELIKTFQRAYEGITTRVQNTWDYIWNSIFGDDGLSATFKDLDERVTDTKDKATGNFDDIGSGFGKLKDSLANYWNVYIKPLIDSWNAAWAGAGRAFESFSIRVGEHFIRMIQTLKAPVRFVIDTIINGTFIKGFNDFAKALGADARIPTVTMPAALRQTGGTGGFAAGGYTGDYGKHVPRGVVHGGEYVEPMESVDHYGMGIFEALHKRRIPKELIDALTGYASGGYVAMGNLIKKQFPFARITSSYRPGDPGYHGSGQAIDIGGAFPYPDPTGRAQMLGINHWIAQTFANITELIHTANGAINLWHGQPHRYSASTALEHMNHVHWAMAGSLLAGASASGSGALSVDPGFLSDPVGWLRNQIIGKLGDFDDKSKVHAIMARLPVKMLEAATSKLKEIAASALSFGLGDAFAASKAPAAAAGGLVALAQSMAAARGWTGAQWDALYALGMKESGFRNTAQNPTSTAYGQWQFLDSTWATVGGYKTSDPRLQNEFGFRYIERRYGNPINALAFHRAHNWYDEGGPVQDTDSATGMVVPDLHDTGGMIMPGLNVLMNRTNRPEASINGQTLDALQSIADRGAAGAALIGQYNQTIASGTPHEAVDELLHQLDVAELGGRYSSRRG